MQHPADLISAGYIDQVSDEEIQDIVITANLTPKLGIRKVIWLEGDPCEPITSGHADGYVLCAPEGVVMVKAIDDQDIEPPLWR